MPLIKNPGILPNKRADMENEPIPELVCIESLSEDENNMYLIEETATEVNFSLMKYPFTGESISVKREPVDFDNRETENEVDQNLDEKPTIQIHSLIKSEEDDLINSQYLSSHEEVNIKPDGDVEQSNTQFKDHKDRHKSKDQIKIYKCPDCPYQSKYQCSIKQHSVKHAFTHNKDHAKWLKCTFCSYVTLNKRNFRRHQMIHQDDPDCHKCPECPYKTTYKPHLLRHAKNHKAADQTDWLQCPECSYRTPRSHHLKAHQMVHTNDTE